MSERTAGEESGAVTIEQAGLRDLNPIRRLEKTCFPLDAWPLLDMLGVLTLPGVVRLKAVDGERAVGFVAVDIRRSQRLAWIATICVDPEYRGRGIGARLLQESERRLDVPRVRLSVRASNESAIRLYHGLGYARVGEWPRYYKGGEDAILMEKLLN